MTRRKLWIEQIVNLVTSSTGHGGSLPPLERVRYCADQLGRVGLEICETRLDRDNMLGLIMFLDQFRKDQARIYKIASRFGHHLARTNLDVPLSAFPVQFGHSYCIEFPDDIAFEGPRGEYWRTCLVNIGGWDPSCKGEAEIVSVSKKPDQLSISLAFPDYDREGRTNFTTSYLSFPLIEATIGECIDRLENHKRTPLVVTRDAINYVVKCLVYIESGEPDLIAEPGHYSDTKKAKKLRRIEENFCPFEVVNVGYSFHERTRHVDETSVVGHFRWQAWGPERSKVKLIWIDEHTRTFR